MARAIQVAVRLGLPDLLWLKDEVILLMLGETQRLTIESSRTSSKAKPGYSVQTRFSATFSAGVLPEDLVTSVTLTPPDHEPPEHFKEFMALPDNEEHGQYPGVFAYRFQNLTVAQIKGHYWAMLFWDRVIITVAFYDPACRCNGCQHPQVW